MSTLLYRYMPVHRLWQMLATKKIYFLRNTMWDDPFEAFLAKRYCISKSRDFNLLNSDKYFLCCTTKRERDHFWRNYTPNKNGVMITLDIASLKGIRDGIIAEKMTYPVRNEIRRILEKIARGTLTKAELTDLFFIKRKAFEDEAEYRLMIQGKSYKRDMVGVDFSPEKTITRILFDPRMDSRTFESHKLFINEQFGPFNVRHSKLYSPDEAFPIKKRPTMRATLAQSPRRAARR